MVLGFRTSFEYAQCDACMSLWLMNPPEDLPSYYGKGYYSLKGSRDGIGRRAREYFRLRRDRAYFGGDILGRFLTRYHEDGPLAAISRMALPWDARILDVGCGTGNLLRRLALLGFKNLTGVDPYLSAELCKPGEARIKSCPLEGLRTERFDAIMFHHSLEHIADPKRALLTAAQMLSPGGTCLVRLPVLAEAWQRYGTNWVQLDAPRHMWIPTEKSMRLLTESVGFLVKRVLYDSTEFQFMGSELYGKGLSFQDISSSKLSTHFRSAQIKEFRKRAAELNEVGDGDSAVFFLQSQKMRDNHGRESHS